MNVETELRHFLENDSAGALMLWASTVSTEFFVRIEGDSKLNVLDITASYMKATHTAVVVTLVLVVVTASTLLIIAHYVFLIFIWK